MPRERTLAVGVQGAGVGMLAGDVGLDGAEQPRLAELAQHDAAKLRHAQRRRAQGDQRLGASLDEGVFVGPGNPLRQHGQGAAGLLVLRQSLPLALENRQGSRVEGVTASKRPCRNSLALASVRRCPPLSTRVAVGRGVGSTNRRTRPWCAALALLVVAGVLEQATTQHLGDLSLIVDDQVLRRGARPW